MATIPVVTVGNNDVVLFLIVDDATRLVTGYTVSNTIGGPVEVNLSSGAFTVKQAFGVGQTTATIPRNRQWNIDTAEDASYGLTVKRAG